MRFAGPIVVAVVILAGCGGETKTDGKTGGVAGLSWTIPEGWTMQHELPMRVATYVIPRAEGDYDNGECGVFFFGEGQGGDVDLNIERWGAQFSGESIVEKTTTSFNDLEAVIVRIEGDYLAPAGPQQESQGLKMNYRLLGAIIEAPDGRVFFKSTGPKKTIEEAQPAFMEMMNSLKAE